MPTLTPQQELVVQQVRNAHATLIAVSKTHPVERIKELYDMGFRDFGENKVQELCAKATQLPGDIRWHLIGHLQTNKVRAVVPYVFMIHSVDSLKLLEEIEKEAARIDKEIGFLFQFHIAREESKFGIDPGQMDWLRSLDFGNNVRHAIPCGVMGMATFTDDEELIATEFKGLRSIFAQLKADVFPNTPSFKEISMGMSSDYQTALECGSTMVRIGSLLFGARG